MPKIRNKNQEENTEREITINPEPTINDELEYYKYIGQVKSDIKDQVGEDFTFAKLEQVDKTAVIEMTSNAYYTQRVYSIAEAKATEWNYNQEKEQWELKNISKQKKNIIRELKRTAFNAYMTRVLMTVIMNRNVPENHLIKMLLKSTEEKEAKELEIIENGKTQTKKKKKKKEEEQEEEA